MTPQRTLRDPRTPAGRAPAGARAGATEPGGRSAWTRADAAALAVAVLVAVALASAPHLATLVRWGTLEYLGDIDEIAYLAIARAPFHGEGVLRDPFSGWWEQVPVAYAWLQFVPLAALTRALGVPLVLMSLVWRVVGGALLGAAVFVLFRRLFSGTRRPALWALGAAVVCLSDAGFVTGRFLLENLSLLPHLAAGTTPLAKADALPQYRVVTPLLNLPFLLLLVASLVPGGRWKLRAAAGAVSLGLCVLLYFYLWTAAFAALGLYGLWLLWEARPGAPDRAGALVELRVVVLAAVGGLAIGAPQVISNLNAFADPQYQPILHRLSKGYPLPPGDPMRTLYLANSWVWLKLAVGLAGFALFRHRALALLWCFTFAGYALNNSALVTGLEFENFHWAYVHAPLGAALVLGVAVLAVDRWYRGPARRLGLLWAVPVALLAMAAVWRPHEALTAPLATQSSEALAALRPLRAELAGLSMECSLAGPDEASVALLFTRAAQLYQHPYTGHVSMIPDSTVHQRHALNGWLRGLDADSYRELAGQGRFAGGPFRRPEWEPGAVVETRLALFQALERGEGGALMERFRPCYLLLPSDGPRPERGGPWGALARSDGWTIWTRTGPAAGAAAVGRAPGGAQ